MRRPALPLALLLLAALALATAPATAAANDDTGDAADPGDAILGHWLTADGEAVVEITRQGDGYHGTIIALDEPIYPADDEQGMAGQPKVDRENPDPALRHRPVIGLEILRGLEYAGDGRWEGGRIYDPDNGKTYRLRAHLRDDGVLAMRGFIGISLLGRTTQWRRAPADSP